MKIIHKTYRLALDPTEEQEILLNKHFGCARFVYNLFLNERNTQYHEIWQSDNYYGQAASSTQLNNRKVPSGSGRNLDMRRYGLSCSA